MDDFSIVSRIVRERGPLCPYCLGSLVGTLLKEFPNYVKGLSLSFILDRLVSSGKGACIICSDTISENIEYLLEKALNKLENIEYYSIKAGVILPPDIIEKEDRIRASYNPPNMESVKVTLIKWLDLLLSAKTGRHVSKEADVEVIFDFSLKDALIKVAPVFVYGRYRKLERGISQSRRICQHCNGQGCEKCNWTGKIAEGSVEGMIGEVIKEAFVSEDYVLHAAGREDVDARMLGMGRPFVMEIISPKKRRLDLEEISKRINDRWKGKIEVIGLRYSNRKEVAKIKEGSPFVRKLYRALVEVEGDISDDELEKLESSLRGIIKQRTPQRVAWRRADIVRTKKVYDVKTMRIGKNIFEMRVLCDGGLYVKELISGDDGRTTPSVSEILGKKSFCRELDVLEVLDNSQQVM
ncbi:MAG: tRNA pseudouridine(54/55) synthase Pus10 [Thermoproteota archaeon]|nr:MAG: tRNA pseudouridine(54/55) synthase Pus10 [Candidatus Korarchaeota archaeon]